MDRLANTDRLASRRVLVVGASGGLGRTIARCVAAEGAALAVAARRVELLRELSAELGGRPHVVACDVRQPESCSEVVDEAVRALGGLDALVYAPGLGVVTRLSRASPDHWHMALETNLIGAGLVTAAAIPHLEASRGIGVYLSSLSAHVTPPWIGMGLYLASKVALEKCIEVWKLEHPEVRFTNLVVGSTSGNDFFTHAEKPDPEELEVFAREWRLRGYAVPHQVGPEEQGQAVVHILASDAQMDTVWVRHRAQFQLPRDQAPME